MRLLFATLKKIFLYIFGVLDTKPDTASLRKTAAVWILVLATIAHTKFVTSTVIDKVLMMDYIFICVLLGLVTAENVIMFFGNKKNEEKQENQGDEPK